MILLKWILPLNQLVGIFIGLLQPFHPVLDLQVDLRLIGMGPNYFSRPKISL